MSLIACGANPPPALIAPPAELTRDCPETQTEVDAAMALLEAAEQGLVPPSAVPVVTNGDLVRKIRSLRVDLARCNADKAALREWPKAD